MASWADGVEDAVEEEKEGKGVWGLLPVISSSGGESSNEGAVPLALSPRGYPQPLDRCWFIEHRNPALYPYMFRVFASSEKPTVRLRCDDSQDFSLPSSTTQPISLYHSY